MPKVTKASTAADISSDNDDVLDKFELMLTRVTKTLSETFNSCVEKLIVSLDQKLSVKLDVQSNELFEANKRIDALEKKLNNAELDNAALRDSLKGLNARIDSANSVNDDLEQYMRGDNLLLHGVPLPADGSKEGDVSQLVVDVLNTNLSGVSLKKEHISTAHRIAANRQVSSSNASSNAASSSTSRPPAIIIRFCQRDMRNNLIQNRRQLKGKSVSLTEQLTPRRAQLLKKANDLVSRRIVQSAWSHDGKILVKSFNNRTLLISSDLDLLPLSSG